MKKNPFPTLIAQHYPDLVKPESCKGWALAMEDGKKFENATPKQIEYAAEAINNYGKVVAMLEKLDIHRHNVEDEDGNLRPACPICEGFNYDPEMPQHTADCPLAALLAEVKP